MTMIGVGERLNPGSTEDETMTTDKLPSVEDVVEAAEAHVCGPEGG